MMVKIAHQGQERHLLQHHARASHLVDVEAQGFQRYCNGLFFSLPALSRAASGE